MMPNRPRFPIYVPTKGRWDVRLTADWLAKAGIPHRLIVEDSQHDAYARHVPQDRLLVLPQRYKDEYEVLDEHGLTRSTGPGPARNFAWDHATEAGHPWHWVMDDNIRGFWRLHKNRKIRLGDGTGLRAMEDFTLRYKNVSMAGPQYYMFVAQKTTLPPFVTNTRIYSCNLIRNDTPFRWRGRYNEDTILSLDMLTRGWCTIQFNAFLQWKTTTQVVKGGNTAEFYAKEGTYPKSKMLVDVYPQYARLAWRFGRIHHHVDYRPFRSMPLIRREDAEIPDGPNEYGLRVVPRKPRTR